MSHRPHSSPVTDPASQADRCSRLTRTIARILRSDLIKDDTIAYAIATRVASGLIDEHGGGKLYIPISDRRAGAKDHAALGDALRAALSPARLAGTTETPETVLRRVAAEQGVSRSTAYRVLAQMRQDDLAGLTGQIV